MKKHKDKFIKIDGIRIECNSSDEVADHLFNYKNNENKSIYIHLNINNYYDAKTSDSFEFLHRQNTTFFFEGIGFKILLFFKTIRWFIDGNGTDAFPVLANKLNSNITKMFFLGATEENISKCIENINKCYPNIISKYRDGYFSIKEEKNIINEINDFAPDYLIIGMGMPKELEFLKSNINFINSKNLYCVGGLFDFISGNNKRAPLLFRKLRIEWFFKLLYQPYRIKKSIRVISFMMQDLRKVRISYE